MKLKAFLLLAFSALLLSPAACSTDGLVGGACAEGHAYCAEVCISILDDETNCGACNQACVRNLACVAGVCGGEDGTAMLPGATGGRGGQGSGGDDMGGSGATGTGASGQGGSGGTGGNSTGGSGAMSGTGGGGGGSVCRPIQRQLPVGTVLRAVLKNNQIVLPTEMITMSVSPIVY